MSNVLQILVEQAKEKADECAKALANTRQQLAQSQDKLAMLESYRDECQAALLNRSQTGITGMQLQGQLLYNSKIDTALKQQSDEIRFLQTAVEKQLATWQNVLAEQKKYETLLQREAQKKAVIQNKREQKMNDEFAARIYRTQTAGESR
ncbi:flagellar export protein FliJ [Limnobacter litoralis]|uniref:Flagellar FliJ protein n=1 Tax=Limnobacter litoralis TaxID=481366 RepID=A0ABQ5YUD5_9BURK|nr:flagellar export protein FliJ [Limnobacter litoralis]GLR27657.1 hypothetical protein GCM10007875_27480 [Limnobacter litoralis]